MRMKKKLRRSFDHAAPDAWGRIQGELPQQQKKTAARGITMSVHKKSPLWEALSTAAALAMAVVFLGGGLWMYLTYGPLRPSSGGPGVPMEPTDSIDPSFTMDPTDPIDPRPEVYVEVLDYFAENILYPWYLRDVVYSEPCTKTLLETVCPDGIYVLPKTMGSYSYEFHFDSWDGKLLGIVITGYTDTVKEFIPESVAEAIALLNGGMETLTVKSTQLIQTGSSGYYAISLIGVADEWSGPTYYIHAQTGRLLTLGEEVEPEWTVGPPASEDPLPPDGIITEDEAIAIAMKRAGVTECSVECRFDLTFPAYNVTLDDGKYIYKITVDFHTGDILAFPTPVLKEDITEIPVPPTEPPSEPLEPPVTPDETTPAEPTEPSEYQEELEKLKGLFKFGKENWYNMSLTSFYTKPEEANLGKFFYNGFKDIPAAGPTPEEAELLKNMPGFEAGFDLIRLPAERMEAVLQEFWGLQLSDFDLSKSSLYYVESKDCYYLSHTDAAGFVDIQFENLVKAEDGTITVDYTASYLKGTLTLVPHGDSYRVVANKER